MTIAYFLNLKFNLQASFYRYCSSYLKSTKKKINKMKLTEFIVLVHNEEDFINYLIEKGVFFEVMECPKCKNMININKNTLQFRCNKVIEKKYAKRKDTKRCLFKLSARKNTFFESKLTVKCVALFVGYFLYMPHPRIAFLKEELQLATATVVDWSNFCREVCIQWCISNSEKLGGPGKIVEIDEAKVGRRKYNRGRIIEGQWIFGGIERGSSKIFLVPVPNRNAETLINVVKEWVTEGTTVISDCWKGYNSLQQEGYEHRTVNHSQNFVDPDSGAHTQNIERTWRDMKAKIPRYGTRKHHYIGYLAEFLFKKHFTFSERINKFFETAAVMYRD